MDGIEELDRARTARTAKVGSPERAKQDKTVNDIWLRLKAQGIAPIYKSSIIDKSNEIDVLHTIQHYSASDVSRTAFSYIKDAINGLGAGLQHGINQVCICCKAGSLIDGKQVGDVEKIIDAVDLKPWSDFYKTKDYAAYKCHSCGYQWSW
jgi:hypothetical protein